MKGFFLTHATTFKPVSIFSPLAAATKDSARYEDLTIGPDAIALKPLSFAMWASLSKVSGLGNDENRGQVQDIVLKSINQHLLLLMT